MNPELASSDIGDSLPVRDCLDERGNKQRRLVPEDMCTEQRASLGIRIELADTMVILKRPAVGDIAVLLGDRHEGTFFEILEASTDRGHLWVAEHRRRYPLV